jgi:acyl-homoserine lactone acylase PvdQ
MGRSSSATACAIVAALALAAPAAAQIPPLPPLPTPPPVPTVPVPPLPGQGPDPQPYQANDGLGFHDVLPSGTAGLYNGADLAAFLATGRTVPHCCEQLGMYADLMYGTPGLQAADIPKYFKDSSFGVRDGDVERRYSPRGDVTIVRDKGFGVPHVYGRDRDGAMFGLGYAAAEDRLFFMDALRHAGRGELSSFAGGSNAAQDADQWKVAPYTEADLERQTKPPPGFPPALAATVASDADNYIAGINRYITEAKLDPTKLPGEYAAIGRPQGPDPWKRTDLIAAASLVGGIFGQGGGQEIAWTQIRHALTARFKRKRALKVFRDFRAAEDPEAPTTVLGRKRFPYQGPPRKLAKGSRAIYNRGTLREHKVVAASSGAAASASTGRKGLLDGLLEFPKAASNAMLVSARESATGKPLMVAGPQVAYFNPQILMEQDVHAPAAAGKPGIDARGASFIGLNLYVQLGRGRDYAWSATSAGQDMIDTYALELCQDDRHYRYRGRCEPMEVIEHTNRWQPSLGDSTPAGTQTLRALRTKLGLVAGYATIGRKKVVLTRLRSTYFHEIDSAVGFMRFNDPAQIRNAADFQRAASDIGYTFNWFYTDAKQIAYFNSGANPARPKGLDPNFPVWGKTKFEWRGFNPDLNTSKLTPFSRHPQVIDQRYLVSWNNKQAKGFRGADSNTFSSAYRSLLLEDRLKPLIKGARKTTLPQMIDAMELAGTTDLRAHVDLPLALKVIGRPKDSSLRRAVDQLRAWQRAGGRRVDGNQDKVYEHEAAIRLLDAWWPLWVRAQFRPALGGKAFKAIEAAVPLDNAPNNHGDHLGSAYQTGWYGYVRKDLRTVLGRKVRGRYARKYCGGGPLRRCRQVLRRSLRDAIRAARGDIYGGDKVCDDAKRPGDQWCYDAVHQRPVGGATQPLIPWINRPTYQQVVEVQAPAPR